MSKSTRQTGSRRRAAKPYQVFVSHATADKWLAVTVCKQIERVGATTFRDDRDIHGGDDIPDEIRRQIKQSREMLVVLTPESVSRPWVLLEVGAAWCHSKRTRIVVVRSHVPVEVIPAILRSTKSITLNELDQYLVELEHRVRSRYVSK